MIEAVSRCVKDACRRRNNSEWQNEEIGKLIRKKRGAHGRL